MLATLEAKPMEDSRIQVKHADAPPSRPMHIGVFGGPLDTGNLGVSALGISVTRGIHEVSPGTRVTLFDHGLGVRRAVLAAGDWRAEVDLFGAAYSRRFYRGSNQQCAYLFTRAGLSALQPLARRIRSLDAILDISGGDSFSDIYGDWRFRAVLMPKRLAIAARVPLILLPQTYGPFDAPQSQEQARELMLGARMIWARDARSLDVASVVLGQDFDPVRHKAGVDVAFGLPACEPCGRETLESISRFTSQDGAVFGLNVSGLLFNRNPKLESEFNLKVDYRKLVAEMARRLLGVEQSRLLLISHVATPCAEAEDDLDACRAAFAQLPRALQERTLVVDPMPDPMQVKWVIGQCDWFCGTRMHSCIAGLSQSIPTATIAYSDKSLGVFECADAGDWVFDARYENAEEILSGILRTVSERGGMRERLRNVAPHIQNVWREQFQSLMTAIQPPSGIGN